MFRLWVKEIENNHLIKDILIKDDSEDTRTHKVFNGLESACQKLDIARPIWLDQNISDFKKFSKTRFTKDSFIEEIYFDYLEISIIEED